jgi:DNA invertase Pin-like site-specific DNA recombinase
MCSRLGLRLADTDLISYSEGIATSTSVGKIVFTFLDAIAEFERSLIQERTRSGLQRAKAAGIHCGRPRKGFDIAEALKLHGQGWGVRRVGSKLGVSYGTIQHVRIRRHGVAARLLRDARFIPGTIKAPPRMRIYKQS